jgi:hypothetical protein
MEKLLNKLGAENMLMNVETIELKQDKRSPKEPNNSERQYAKQFVRASNSTGNCAASPSRPVKN